MNTEFKIFAELFVGLFEIFSVFCDFLEEFKTFFGDVLLDNFKDFVMLEILSADVERKIFGVNHTSDESKIFRDQLFAIVHNEDSSNVQFNIIFLLLCLEHIEGCSLGNENYRFEFETSFNRKLLNSKMVFPIVGETLVET